MTNRKTQRLRTNLFTIFFHQCIPASGYGPDILKQRPHQGSENVVCACELRGHRDAILGPQSIDRRTICNPGTLL